MSRLPRLSIGARSPRRNGLSILTCITTTRRPILTTLNRMSSQNRMGRLTTMGRLPCLTIPIRPTWQTFHRRLTWPTRPDRRICVTRETSRSSMPVLPRPNTLTDYTDYSGKYNYYSLAD